MYERHGATAGGRRERLYSIWRGMIGRCEDTANDAYPYYGAKGVRLCDEWRESYSAFRRWALVNGYRADTSIDRMESVGNYEPGNCRWSTDKQQARNRGPAVNHLLVTHRGRTLNLFAWAQETGLNYTTLLKRHRAGETGDRLFRLPRRATIQISRAVLETRNGNAKLGEAQVHEVLTSKETGKAIALRLGVSPALVSMIRSKQRRAVP